MKTNEINIRDPFVLLDGDTYYMYGTRGPRCWGKDDGLDCYYSKDLKEWTGPVEVFHKPLGFWADQNYWAPECHSYQGNYYIFASFKADGVCRGTQILKADHPLGPFQVHSESPVTPKEWECLDGTLYVDSSQVPYIVFCHEWVQIGDGEVCAIPLSLDLKTPVGEPKVLFRASEAPWIKKLDTDRLGKDVECYCTDGPFLYRCQDKTLLMLWSSFGEEGYTEAIAKSDNGDITGCWEQEKELLFQKDGGHGMLFKTKEGTLMLALHSPNETLKERPVFYKIQEKDGNLFKGEQYEQYTDN